MMVAQNAKNVMEPQVQLRQFFIKNTFHIFCERCFALVANLANYTSKNLPKRVQPVKIKVFFKDIFTVIYWVSKYDTGDDAPCRVQ